MPDDKKLPEGWKTISLEEVLPETSVKPLTKVLNDIRGGKITGSDVHRKLLEVLEPHKEHLEKKGVLPAYLAYQLEYAVTSGGI